MSGQGFIFKAFLPAAIALLPEAGSGALDEVLWEKNRGWAPSSTVYFEGTACDVDGGAPCPAEMGWQGNKLTWRFPLPADARRTPDLRFELVVREVFHPLRIAVSAGPAGSALKAAGELGVSSPGIYRLPIPSEVFLPGVRNEIRLSGDNPVGYGEPSGCRWMAAGLYRQCAEPPDVSDEELLDDTQWRACRYFLEQSYPNGLVLDSLGSDAASLAAVGFGATAMTILADRAGSTSRWTLGSGPAELAAAARDRALSAMRTILAIQGRQTEGGNEWGFAGVPYHFLDAEGRRARSSEVSTIDVALMLAGILQAGEYFGGEAREMARTIFGSVDLKRFFRSATGRYSHGWTPEKGIISTEWDRPGDEALLVCLLSLAQDPDDPERLRACYSYPRVAEAYRGVSVVRSYFGSLFTYNFAHFWIPFECLGKDRPASAGASIPAVDWWENSRRAAEANRLYHLDRFPSFPALGREAWGASACYRADRIEYFGPNGAEPAEATAAFDGTLPPHGAIMSLQIARSSDPEELPSNPAFVALRHFYRTRFAALWCSYGPRSSFDHLGNTSPMAVGIEKGPEALGIEAYRTGMPARLLGTHPAVTAALARVFERGACPPRPKAFVRGRVNGDGTLDISDPVYLLGFLFTGGSPPACEDAADSNDDGRLDVSDSVYLLSFLFLGTPAPPNPFPAPGFDPTEDGLAPCLSDLRSG